MEASGASEDTVCDNGQWIQLTEKKQFSRLLYTNPVCFLTTVDAETKTENVMVLSWLTATNNDGAFLFSLNRRRHTSTLLKEGGVFGLSVPVRGMEDLVRSVGRASGRNESKFRRGTSGGSSGIPGLYAVPMGNDHDSSSFFAVKGTVAHLQCHATRIQEPGAALDDQHFLVFAQVVGAFVHPSYWEKKNVFSPSPTSPPYLTFFGSQTFGYVVTDQEGFARSVAS
mmetsp:Transcript_14850/g.34321  ORF Transcript_14850/g.34321 Transcript_14850/m.34321 type:complete len:226 (+) Transcript_14850:2320-2997(+)